MSYMLSVIIPVYQVEDYLEKCIDSVIREKAFLDGKAEVILVDDGSKDNSGLICDKYSNEHKNISVIHKENEGLSAARNTGIMAAKGKYLFFLDSDDYITENALSNILEKAEEDSDVILCRLLTDDAVTGEICEPEESLDDEKISSLRNEELLNYLITGRIYGWYAFKNIIKKEFLIKNSLFFEVGRLFEDALWTPGVLYCAEKLSYIDTPVYVYFINRVGSIVRQVSKKACFDKINVLRSISDFCDNNALSIETKNKMLANVSQIYVSILADSRLLDKKSKKELLNESKKYVNAIKYSIQKYKRILYFAHKFIGINGISFILYLRAEYVRHKNSK